MLLEMTFQRGVIKQLNVVFKFAELSFNIILTTRHKFDILHLFSPKIIVDYEGC